MGDGMMGVGRQSTRQDGRYEVMYAQYLLYMYRVCMNGLDVHSHSVLRYYVPNVIHDLHHSMIHPSKDSAPPCPESQNDLRLGMCSLNRHCQD